MDLSYKTSHSFKTLVQNEFDPTTSYLAVSSHLNQGVFSVTGFFFKKNCSFHILLWGIILKLNTILQMHCFDIQQSVRSVFKICMSHGRQ